MSDVEKPQLQVFMCGVKCDAGGPVDRDGHLFNIEWESEDGLCSGYRCKCGLDNMSFDMARSDE